MKKNTFILFRLLIVMIVTFTVSTAVSIDNFFLAIGGVVIGILFMFLVRRRTKVVLVDERIENISGRAARSAYSVVTMTLVVLGMFFIIHGSSSGDLYSESLGVSFSFVALFNIALYSISFYYFNYRYGGTNK